MLARVSLTSGLARSQHRNADHDHQHTEQRQQAAAAHHLAEMCAAGRADNAGDREH